MINPYEPPNDIRYLPFHKRFRRALKRAIDEYLTGLKRENFTATQHALAWLGLCLLGLVMLLAIAMVAVFVLLRLGLLA